MTREEAFRLAMRACEETWNEKTCKQIREALEQEPCEDEYIKVPKKALKYRTAGMVAYNAEWLKNHFDLERAVICGAQEPKADVLDKIRAEIEAKCCITVGRENDGAITLHDVFEIIDKYKADIEPQESEEQA